MGSVARFLVGRWIGQRTSGGFPFGTLLINTAGCVVIGVIAARLTPGRLYNFWDIGFTAAFTTFSTFSYETWRLVEEKLMSWALLNMALNIGLGLTGVEAGFLLGRL